MIDRNSIYVFMCLAGEGKNINQYTGWVAVYMVPSVFLFRGLEVVLNA